MIKPKVPVNEDLRLKELLSYHILDTEKESEYDALTALAASIADTPVALISLIDSNRQWFKSCFGFDGKETDRDIAFCAHAINQKEIFVIPNALEDERFKHNPLVVSGPLIRFYAGVPLINDEGFALGTLCTIDTKPKNLTDAQKQQLALLATQVVKLMELRKANLKIKADYQEITNLTSKVLKQQTELELALGKAQKADEVKTAFVANLSHEIRTPINGISGIISLLEDSEISPIQEEYIKTIKTSCSTLLHVVNDILDFSKIESGKLDIENIDVNLYSELDYITKTIRHGAKKKGLEFTSNTYPTVKHYVKGDPHRMRQILLNLGNNAIKFTNAGSISVDYQSLERDSKTILQVKITDTGIGMTQEHLTKLFTPFNQADASTTRKYGGTGLGLSIVKQLVDLLNGTIKVESTLGVGTVFILELPFIKTDVPVTKEVKINKLSSINYFNTGIKLILAEDNEVNQKVQKSILEKMGYDVVIAGTGQEVITELSKNSYDLILMDMQMPDMDGLECTRHIRKSLNLSIPIIALTANTIKGDREKCLSAGMNHFISKPFNLQLLNDIIFTLVGKNKNLAPHIKNEALDRIKNRDEDLQLGDEEAWIYLKTFYTSSSNKLEKILQAYQNKDLITIKNEVHSLKSSSLYVGEADLSAVCEQLENFLSGPARPEQLNLFNHFTKQLRRTLSKMEFIISQNNKDN